MFSRVYSLFFFLFFALPLLASAVVLPRSGDGINNSCNTADIKCCNSVQAANSASVTSLIGLLGIVIGDVTGLVGLTCSPLSIIGTGGNSCTAQPVCCTGNTFNGLITLGCSPININL